jgi:hypothetical protein
MTLQELFCESEEVKQVMPAIPVEFVPIENENS